MDKEDMKVECLSRDELAEVNGGLPYEKPMFVLLDGVLVTCDIGMACNTGHATYRICVSGGYCFKGKFGTETEPENK